MSYTSVADYNRYSGMSFAVEPFRQAQVHAADVVDVFGFAQDRVSLAIDGLDELDEATAVSGNYFGALGLVPAQGRLLVESDDRPEAPAAAVISDSLWKRRFNRASDVVMNTGRQRDALQRLGVAPRPSAERTSWQL